MRLRGTKRSEMEQEKLLGLGRNPAARHHPRSHTYNSGPENHIAESEIAPNPPAGQSKQACLHDRS